MEEILNTSVTIAHSLTTINGNATTARIQEMDPSGKTNEFAAILTLLFGVLIPLLIAIFLMELYIQRKKEIATVGAENEGSNLSMITLLKRKKLDGEGADLSNVLRDLETPEKVYILSNILTKAENLQEFAETKLLNLHHNLTMEHDQSKAKAKIQLSAAIEKIEDALNAKTANANRAFLKSKIRPSSIDILKLGGQMDVNDFTEEAEGTIISVVYAPPDEENPLLAENI